MGRSTPRDKKGPTTKVKYTRGQGTQTIRRKEVMPREKRREVDIRIKQGWNETMEKLDMVWKPHGAPVYTKRGLATSAVEGER